MLSQLKIEQKIFSTQDRFQPIYHEVMSFELKQFAHASFPAGNTFPVKLINRFIHQRDTKN